MKYITERITIDEGLMDRKPTIRGMRVTVYTILEFLGEGDSVEEILKQYPYLEKDDIFDCIKFAAQLVNSFSDRKPRLSELLKAINGDNLHGEIKI